MILTYFLQYISEKKNKIIEEIASKKILNLFCFEWECLVDVHKMYLGLFNTRKQKQIYRYSTHLKENAQYT